MTHADKMTIDVDILRAGGLLFSVDADELIVWLNVFEYLK